MKTIKLPCFNIQVQIDEKYLDRGNIISNLHEKMDDGTGIEYCNRKKRIFYYEIQR